MDSDEVTTVCKRDALGRVKVPKAQREALLDEFERSSLSGAQFASAAGVHYQTFAWWVQQRRHARGEYARKPKVPCAALQLVEAVVAVPEANHGEREAQPAIANVAEVPLEVLLPGGAKVLVRDRSQVPLVAQLLQALSQPC